LAKAGEIAIVRSNHEKAAKEHEKRLAVLQQMHSEEIARQKAELEAARKDREKVETDNRFLEHDLAQEAERAKTRTKTLKDGHGNLGRKGSAKQSPVTTPKKDKTLAFRDGFDDDEVFMVSPSKSKPASKASTPRAGVKRKRAMTEQSESRASPGQHLASTGPEGLPEVEYHGRQNQSTLQNLSIQPVEEDCDEKYEVGADILT